MQYKRQYILNTHKDHSQHFQLEGGETSTYSEIDLYVWKKLICCVKAHKN